jgi:ankyrin repeat protein
MPGKSKSKPNMMGAGARGPTTPTPIEPAIVSVCGLIVGLLDVGRVVALNGYADACKLLPFLSRDFLREDDFLIATKHVRYGPKKRTRLMSLARKGDEVRVARLLRVIADIEARDAKQWRPLHLASKAGHAPVVRFLHNNNGADA